MKTYLTILILLFTFGTIDLQGALPEQKNHFYYLQMTYQGGAIKSRTQYLSEQFAGGSRAIEVRLGYQSGGEKLWQQFHNLPRYGVGFHYADLISDRQDTIIGNPFSVFAFFGAPLVRAGRFTLGTDISGGLSYTSRYHDPLLNPYNDVIASHFNFFFGLNLNLRYNLGQRVELVAGGGLTHFSNGDIHEPQKGVNTYAYNLGMVYRLPELHTNGINATLSSENGEQSKHSAHKSTYWASSEEVQIMASVGVLEEQKLGELEGIHYITTSVTADYAVPVRQINFFTFGLDYFYNSSLERAIKGIAPDDVTTSQKMYLGSHIGYQIVIQRLTILFNLGTYFKQSSNDSGFWFMRAGGRIRLADPLHLHICIKSKNGIRSDWIEWGLAYSIHTR